MWFHPLHPWFLGDVYTRGKGLFLIAGSIGTTGVYDRGNHYYIKNIYNKDMAIITGII
jgi:hypothetical protein